MFALISQLISAIHFKIEKLIREDICNFLEILIDPLKQFFYFWLKYAVSFYRTLSSCTFGAKRYCLGTGIQTHEYTDYKTCCKILKLVMYAAITCINFKHAGLTICESDHPLTQHPATYIRDPAVLKNISTQRAKESTNFGTRGHFPLHILRSLLPNSSTVAGKLICLVSGCPILLYQHRFTFSFYLTQSKQRKKKIKN